MAPLKTGDTMQTEPTVLHIFPTYGRWENTSRVHVLSTTPGTRLTSAHRLAQHNAPMGRIRTYDRHEMSVILSHPTTRQVYEDIVIYADPYTEDWCRWCDNYTYHYTDSQLCIFVCDDCATD